MAQKAYSLSHTKWMCKYHIVFTPKYRRKVIYNQIRSDIGEILRKLCEYKGIEIIEGHLMPDHVHVLLAIPPAEFVNTSLDRVDDFHVFGMGVFRLQHDERFPKGGGNLDIVAVHCPTSSGSMPISASMPAGISSGSSPESSSIKPYSWASARSIATRTSSE